jgi:hypothetical protein|tara:strand:+ start:4740 stop:7211 length:2472 start_codon:yes stop_codon:yes gene_type:complete
MPARGKGSKRARENAVEDDEAAVGDFVRLTNVDENLARRRMRAANGDLARALDAHYAIESVVSARARGISTTTTKAKGVDDDAKGVDDAFDDAIRRARAMNYFDIDGEGFYRSIPLSEEAEAFCGDAFAAFGDVVARNTTWMDSGFRAAPASVDGRDGARGTKENVPKCRCGMQAKVKQVSKDGVNQGRLFYGCAKPAAENTRCDFFAWAKGDNLMHTDAAKSLVWKRFSSPRFKFARRTSAADIRQGSVGDCWFLSSLAVVAEREDLLESVIGVSRRFAPIMERVGAYFIRLFLGGRWRAIVVDDFIPVKPKKDDEFAPAFGKASKNQTWVSIVEKAYAKAHGSYAAISGGYVAEGLHDLTGSATEMISFSSTYFDSEEFWVRLVSFSSAGFPLGCATSFSAEGIVGHHAYSILEVREMHGVKKGVQTKLPEVLHGKKPAVETEMLRLLKIRNPWGKKEWRGEFSSTSASWTKRLGDELSRTRANDGEFWISYNDFLVHFSSVDVCKSPKGWHALNLETTLHPDVHRSYIVRSAGDGGCWCHVLLLQHTKRGRPQGSWYTDLSVLVWRRSLGSSEWMPCGGIFGARERESCQGEIVLDAGTEYAFRVLSIVGGRDVPVTLRLCTAKPVRARQMYESAMLNVAQNMQLAVHGETSLTGGSKFKRSNIALCGGVVTVASSSGLNFVFIQAEAVRKSPLCVDFAYRFRDDGTCFQNQNVVTARAGTSRLAVVASGVSAHSKHEFEFDYCVRDCDCHDNDDSDCVIVEERRRDVPNKAPEKAPRRCEELFVEVDASLWPPPLPRDAAHVKRGSFNSSKAVVVVIHL